MKKYFLFGLAVIFIFSSCHRHSIPSASNPSAASVYTKPVIIVDAHGNIVASSNDLPPNADKSILNVENARSFTPEQQKNLAFRFKYIPPKIFYVPDALTKTNGRGTYYIYNSKFWYWKKSNGYFYLDETYYN